MICVHYTWEGGNMTDNTSNKKKGLNWPLTIVSVGILFIIVAMLALRPEQTISGIKNVFDAVMEGTGPFMLIFDLFLVIFCFYLAFSKYGKIRLGEGKPDYSTFSYIAMMACAALASASMFWSFTEWAQYIITPGLDIEPYSDEAYNIAVGYTFFHWGFLAQCIYVLVGLVTAYAWYIRKAKSLKMSDVINKLIGDDDKHPKLRKAVLWIVDLIVIFITLAGLGVSLGLGVPVIAGGINAVTGIPVTFGMKVIIVVGLGIIFSWSSFVGTGKGMKFLSDNTVKLLFAFLIFVLIAGPTSFIFKTFVNGVGQMGQHFISMALFSDPIKQTGFAETWTIFFIAFPLSYTGLMAVFVAKISKGRSIKELVLCCMLGISIGTWVFFSVNSGLAMDRELSGVFSTVNEVKNGDPYAGVFSLLNTLPLGKVLAVVYTLCVCGFICTTLDTASLALASTTSDKVDKDNNPNKMWRLFWCVMLCLLPLAMMFSGADFEAMKQIAILIAIPIAIVMCYMIYKLRVWLKEDKCKYFIEEEVTGLPLDTIEEHHIEAIMDEAKQELIEEAREEVEAWLNSDNNDDK